MRAAGDKKQNFLPIPIKKPSKSVKYTLYVVKHVFCAI
jgi:hypothetical protein